MSKIKNIFINLLTAALLAAGSAGTALAQFTGDFSQAGGANFDGGDYDLGMGVAFYADNVYAVGLSSPSGAIAVKYDLGGTVVSSAVLAGVEIFTGVAVNANGVYLAAQGAGTGFVVAKYTADLTFISSAAVSGDSSARGLALGDGPGDVFVSGSNWGEAGGNYDYKIAKFDSGLVFQSSSAFNYGGMEEGGGIAFDNGYVYITGTSLSGPTTYFVTAKYDAATLSYIDYSTYSGTAFLAAAQPSTSRLAVNPVSHDLYLVASSSYTKILVVRYSDALAELGSAEFQSA
ncbi:MAG: hypothetical protein HY550_12060, partial [Elusimicrobia bacterium]|nr:hypothetical protein [Elusimicrobiota bacterium]